MAHSSLGRLESIMKNPVGYGHHGSSLGPSLQTMMKNQFDLVDDDFEEPCSVLDLTQCISPPLPSDVWAEQQAAMEYEQLQQQAQILWEQQQIFLWQQQQQQQTQLWDQQQFSIWEQQAELQYVQNMGLGNDHSTLQSSTWDNLQYIDEDVQLHGDPWMNSAVELHQEHTLSSAQLQGLPPLDDPFIFENWMAASGDSTLASVTDESSSISYLMTDDHHDSSSFSTEQQQASSGSHGFSGQPGNTSPGQLDLDIAMEDQELQLAMNNFNPSTCVDIQSSMEELKPSSNWFLPIQHDSLQSPHLETLNLSTQPQPMISQASSEFQMALPNVAYARSEVHHQRPLQQQVLSSFVDESELPSVEITEPKPIALPQSRRPAESPTSSSGGSKTNKPWGLPRPASHSLGSNEMNIHAKDMSDSEVTTMSRRRSSPDFMGDLNAHQTSSTGGHPQIKSSPAQSKMRSNNNNNMGNASSTASSGRGQATAGSGRSMTLAELASGGVKMGGVQLPTVGIQIPSVVRLNMETQASGLGGVRMVQVLLACAEAVACRDSRQANILLQQLQHMASPYGDAMQRITACFVEGLTARLAITGSQPFKFTNPPRKPPSEPEKLEGFNLVYQSSPYVAFGHFAANSAILEAFEGEETMHIVDLGMTHALQWPYLIHGLAKRPGGPPRLLRITGFGLSTDSMNKAGEELTRIARDAKVPFEFRCVTESLEGLKRSMLQLREGEALAVNSVLQLHCVVKESRGSLNAVLQSIHELSPKILTLVEQDASHNGPFFLGRFMEALHYYSAIFDSLDAILPRSSKQRVKMEQFHFAEEIKNIVSCEGPARVERHERVDQWRRRMSRAGFQPLPLKFLSQARMWLAMYSCEGYTLSEEKGCLVLGWKGKPIIAASSWKR